MCPLKVLRISNLFVFMQLNVYTCANSMQICCQTFLRMIFVKTVWFTNFGTSIFHCKEFFETIVNADCLNPRYWAFSILDASFVNPTVPIWFELDWNKFCYNGAWNPILVLQHNVSFLTCSFRFLHPIFLFKLAFWLLMY